MGQQPDQGVGLLTRMTCEDQPVQPLKCEAHFTGPVSYDRKVEAPLAAGAHMLEPNPEEQVKNILVFTPGVGEAYNHI
jgi:hypothetical protein